MAIVVVILYLSTWLFAFLYLEERAASRGYMKMCDELYEELDEYRSEHGEREEKKFVLKRRKRWNDA